MNRPHYLHLEAFSQHHTRDLSYVLIFMNLFWDQKTQSLIERIKFLPFVVLEIANVTTEFANICPRKYIMKGFLRWLFRNNYLRK